MLLTLRREYSIILLEIIIRVNFLRKVRGEG